MMNSFIFFASNIFAPSRMSNVTIVLLYTAILVIVTSIISLKSHDPDPMLAGRNMPWWLVGASIVGTSISSIAFLAYPAKGYALDFNFLIGRFLGEIIAGVICVFCFVAFLRKTRDASIYTLLNDRFGRWSSIYASIVFIIYSIVRMGVITCLVAQAIHLICGVDIVSVIILTGAIVVFYTYMSGIEGVIWTDFFQTIILITVGVASVYFLLDSIPHPEQNFRSVISNISLLKEKNLELKSNWNFLIIPCLFFTTMHLGFYSANQGVAQRYIVARSNTHAKWGLAIGGILLPCLIVLFFCIGILLYIFYQVNPQVNNLPSYDTGNIFAHFITTQFPDGLKGLAIVGILAAAMSTIDTGINSSATVLICNLYQPFVKVSVQKQSLLTMQILRASSVAFGAAGILAAYLIHLNGEGTLEFFWRSLGIVNSGIYGLFILMRVSKAGSKAAIGGLTCGFILALWMTFTVGKDYAWASPFHYMLVLPMSVTMTTLVGFLISKFIKENAIEVNKTSHMLSAKARQQIAQKRRRIFSDSIRLKPFYRLYAGTALLIAIVLCLRGSAMGLASLDLKMLGMSAGLLALVIALPWFINNTYHKLYTGLCVCLLGIALPFTGAIGLFSHPNEYGFGGFYLITLVTMGAMVGWTMLGLATMLLTAVAAQLVGVICPTAGVPDNWAIIAIGAVAVFTYYGVEAAKENLITERTLDRMHIIVEKIYAKAVNASIDLMQLKRSLNIQDIGRLTKASSDIKLMVSALLGATDIHPEEVTTKLSVREILEGLLKNAPKKAQAAAMILGDDDFVVLGHRDIFENILGHVLDNAFYYVELGQATQVVCTLNKHKKTLTIANNGPTIAAKQVPYLFDLGYTYDKESLGLGLSYCKKMLESMRSSIRLVSKPNQSWVQFRLYFPKYSLENISSSSNKVKLS